MTLIDAAVVVVLALAVVTGLLRGIVRPLITWAFIIAGVIAAFFHPALAATLTQSPALRPVVGIGVVLAFGVAGAILGRLIAPMIYARVPLLRTLDRGVGMVISVFFAAASLHMLLTGLVTVDAALTPLTRSTSVSAVQLAQTVDMLRQHPELASLLNPDDVSAAQQQIGRGTVATDNLGKLSGPLGVWAEVHHQLADSHVAPIVYATVEHIPVIGHGPAWPAP